MSPTPAIDPELTAVYLERLAVVQELLRQIQRDTLDYQKALKAAYQILEQLRAHPLLGGALSLSPTMPLPSEQELPIFLDFLTRVMDQLLKSGLEPELLRKVRQGLTYLLPRLWTPPEHQQKTFAKLKPSLAAGATLFQNDTLKVALQDIDALPPEAQIAQVLKGVEHSLIQHEPEQTGLIVGGSMPFVEQILMLCTVPGLYWQACVSWQEAVQASMINPPAVVVFQWEQNQSQNFPTTEALAQMDTADIVAVTSDFSTLHLENMPERVDQILELKWLPRFLPGLLRKSLMRQRHLAHQRRKDFLTGLPSPLGIYEQYEHIQGLFNRMKAPFSMAVLKLERFRLIEEEQGPYLASQWLKSFSQKLKATLRRTDSVGRWSPDRFLLLFPHTPVSGALIALEKLQHGLEQDQPFLNNPDYLPAFSSGLLQIKPEMAFEEALLESWKLMQASQAPGGSPICFKAEEANTDLQPHILLLDDDPLILQMLRFVMSKQGFQVTQLSDGNQILNVLAQTPISLIIMDVKMPGMDGFEVLEMIRKQREFDALPIVMLTSLKGEEHIARGFDLGANDYLYKPFSPSELVIRIRRFLK
ncbi:MAG: response regulator [Candidatus Sericytochromatia bacterium]|nr:response regulator [Candidatus Sericytochromatia bacterium]